MVTKDKMIETKVLKGGLCLEEYQVKACASSKQELELAGEKIPGLVILGIMVTAPEGIEALRSLRVGNRNLPVFFLSGFQPDEEQGAILEAGEDGATGITLTFESENLLTLLHNLIQKQPLQKEDNPVLHYSNLILDSNSHVAYRGQDVLALTGLEFKLLQVFMEHPQQVLSKEALLEQVWGYEFQGKSNLVEVYVMQLRQKLEKYGAPRVLHTVRGSGYILREQAGACGQAGKEVA
ncbi:MAG TPA: response regulator transcription factor [Chloroflexia bacterium]|nr:response regulator transcription factor [Chloroflexia bacterium]